MVIGEITLAKTEVDTKIDTTDTKISDLLGTFGAEVILDRPSLIGPYIGQLSTATVDRPVTEAPAVDPTIVQLESLYQTDNTLDIIDAEIRDLQATARANQVFTGTRLLRHIAPKISWGIDTI